MILLLAYVIEDSPRTWMEHRTNCQNLRPVTVTGTNVIKYSWGPLTPVTFLRF